MIIVRDLYLSFGPQKIFDGIDVTFTITQKVGIVGRNGSGKSTLLKVIAGHQSVDEGTVALDGTKTIAYMPQDMIFSSTKKVFEEIFSVFDQYIKLEHERDTLEHQLSEGAPDAAELIERYNRVIDKLQFFDRADAQKRTEDIIKNLGFSDEQQQQTVDTLSVGWKMRIVLAKLLLQQADFYLFDEPTNHLDITTKEWFLSFLQQAPFGFLLVTHDRYFLEKACTIIFELERGKGTMYYGNFTLYLEQKEERQLAQKSAYDRQQRDITRKQETIDRFKASASKAKSMQSMMKKLDKMELIEIEPPLPAVSFHFPPTTRSGKVVLTLKDISYAFGTKPLFSDVSIEVVRGQKLALVAPNGKGKTTLFNIITGKLPLQHGSIEFGHNVLPAFFQQDQTLVLNPENTVIEEVTNACREVSETTIRSFLGSFLFHSDEIKKKIKVLSGGEKNRVAMIKVLLQKANLLLLDEPTNHLDLYAKDVLLQALQQYDGTMIFVSHDHTFIQNLATGILSLTPNGLHYYPGTFEEFLDDEKRKKSTSSGSKEVAAVPRIKTKIVPQAETKKIKELEVSIARLEQEEQKIMGQLEKLVYGTPEYQKAVNKLATAQMDLNILMQEWEKMLSEGKS